MGHRGAEMEQESITPAERRVAERPCQGQASKRPDPNPHDPRMGTGVKVAAAPRQGEARGGPGLKEARSRKSPKGAVPLPGPGLKEAQPKHTPSRPTNGHWCQGGNGTTARQGKGRASQRPGPEEPQGGRALARARPQRGPAQTHTVSTHEWALVSRWQRPAGKAAKGARQGQASRRPSQPHYGTDHHQSAPKPTPPTPVGTQTDATPNRRHPNRRHPSAPKPTSPPTVHTRLGEQQKENKKNLALPKNGQARNHGSCNAPPPQIESIQCELAGSSQA